ncbi:hypothetical protein Tco_1052608 [Tanacetum coccineum]
MLDALLGDLHNKEDQSFKVPRLGLGSLITHAWSKKKGKKLAKGKFKCRIYVIDLDDDEGLDEIRDFEKSKNGILGYAGKKVSSFKVLDLQSFKLVGAILLSSIINNNFSFKLVQMDPFYC